MVANRIKGITVEIGGDTTKLQTALKEVNSEIRNTQSQRRSRPILPSPMGRYRRRSTMRCSGRS